MPVRCRGSDHIAIQNTPRTEYESRLSALIEAMSTLTRCEGHENTGEKLLELMGRSVSAIRATLLLISEDGTRLIPLTEWRRDSEPEAYSGPYYINDMPAIKEVLSGHSGFASGRTGSKGHRFAGEGYYLAVPVYMGGEPAGIIEMARDSEFAREEESYLEAFSKIFSLDHMLRKHESAYCDLGSSLIEVLFNVTDPIVITSEAGIILNANDPALKITGASRNELSGANLNDFLSFTEENTGLLKTESGTDRNVSVSKIKSFSDGNRVLLNIIRPVAETGYPVADTREYHEFIKGLITHSPFGIRITDRNGTCVVINKAAMNIFCYGGPENVIGKYNLLDDDVLKSRGVMPRINSIFHSGTVADYTIPYDLPATEGEGTRCVKVIRTVAFPVFDARNTVEHAVLIYEDLTDRKAMEKDFLDMAKDLSILNEVSRLIVSTATLHDLLDVMANNFPRTIDADNCYIALYNPEERRFEYAAATSRVSRFFSGKKPYITDDDSKKVLSQIVMETQGPLIVEDVRDYRMADVDRKIANATGTRSLIVLPMMVGSKFIGTIGLDSTGHSRTFKQKDINLMATITNQAAIMIERALLFNQLIKANDRISTSYQKLKEFDRLKTDLLTVNSHELRTPLTSIRGYTELLRDGVLGPLNNVQMEKVSVIDRNVSRMMSVVDNLSELSKAGTVSFEIKKEKTSIYDVVRTSVSAIRPISSSKQINLLVHVPDGIPDIYADRSKLIRVLDNLLDNAVKFTPPGGRITVNVWSYPDHVRFEVSDTGIGIAPEDLERIFTGFYRTGGCPTTDYTGIGIGLAIAKGIVEAHGGKIWAESKIGVGSTFQFTIPR